MEKARGGKKSEHMVDSVLSPDPGSLIKKSEVVEQVKGTGNFSLVLILGNIYIH